MVDLAITTSTDVLSVAVSNSEAVGCETLFLSKRHAEEITPALKRLSKGFEFSLDEIENIYLDIGPGRFTGLRVGIATAIGVALGSSATINTLNSLEVLRHSLTDTHRHGPTQRFFAGTNSEGEAVDFAGAEVLCLIDARRGEFFGQRFVGMEPQGEISIFTPQALTAELTDQSKSCFVIGDGADLYFANNSELAVGSDSFQHLPNVRCSAEVMLKMNALASVVGFNSVEPLYLREPDAVAGFKTKSDDVGFNQ